MEGGGRGEGEMKKGERLQMGVGVCACVCVRQAGREKKRRGVRAEGGGLERGRGRRAAPTRALGKRSVSSHPFFVSPRPAATATTRHHGRRRHPAIPPGCRPPCLPPPPLRRGGGRGAPAAARLVTGGGRLAPSGCRPGPVHVAGRGHRLRRLICPDLPLAADGRKLRGGRPVGRGRRVEGVAEKGEANKGIGQKKRESRRPLLADEVTALVAKCGRPRHPKPAPTPWTA